MSWGVELTGHEFDLLDWKDALRRPFEPWVEVVKREGLEDLYVLRSADLDRAVTSEEAVDRGCLLVDRLNGAMALERRSKPLQMPGVLEFRPDGAIGKHIRMGTGNAEGRSRTSIVSGVAEDGLPPQPSSAQRWHESAEPQEPHDQAAADHAELVSDLLVYLGRCNDWFDLYKAIEAMEKLAGSEHKLRKQAGGHAAILKSAKFTADDHRHLRPRPERERREQYGPQRVTLGEARRAVFAVARIVLG